MSSKFFGALGVLGAVAIGLGSVVVAPAPAQAAATDVSTAPGRAVGSGKWGYTGQFGKLNKTAAPALGEFFLPYGIDISGNQIAVTDSGYAS